MQVIPDVPAQQFLSAHWRIRQKLFRNVNPALRQAQGVDIPEIFLLRFINESNLSPTEIADTMLVPAHAISRKLDTLEKEGLIERSLDPNDNRKRVLTATAKGQQTLKQAMNDLNEEIDKLLGNLTKQEQTTLITLMNKVTQS